MSVIKTWKVEAVTVKDTYEGNQNVVFTVTYSFRAEILNSNPKSRVLVDAITLSAPGATFIPFENLTEETVLGWVFNDLGATRVADIENKVTTEVINMSLPDGWSSPTLPWANP